jgi:hypothetical protein
VTAILRRAGLTWRADLVTTAFTEVRGAKFFSLPCPTGLGSRREQRWVGVSTLESASRWMQIQRIKRFKMPNTHHGPP